MSAERVGALLLGVCLIVGSIASLLVWLFAAAWVGATAAIGTWAFFCGLLTLLIVVFLAGAGLVVGRFPTGRGRLAWGVVVIVPLGDSLEVTRSRCSSAARTLSGSSRKSAVMSRSSRRS